MISSNVRINEHLPSGCYKSPDDIKNFKIRICFRKLTPSFLPLPDSSSHTQGADLELQTLQTNEKNSYAECEFKWQEKVSKDRKDVRRSISQTSAKSVEDNKNESNHFRIFTYVDSELRSTDGSNNGMNSSFSKNECILRKRNIFQPDAKTYQKPFIVDEKDVIKKPSTPNKRELTVESMAIMAVLEQDDNNLEEIQLCLLRYDIHGVLAVSPDFNRESYYIQNSSMEIFEFKIQNASKSMSKDDTEKEQHLIKQIAHHHSDIVASTVGNSFDMPPKDAMLWHLNGEICSGKDFEGRYIFISYFFQSSKWLILEDESSGVTHSCRLKRKNATTLAEFGFPFSLAISVQLKELCKSDDEMPSLRMIVEVTSMDFWGMLRNEGYGFCDIPFVPGSHSFTIPTWKLLPSTITGWLENFFLGGGPKLKDCNFVTIPDELQDTCLGKHGIKTETSGTVSIKIQMLMHFGSETSTDNLINK